MTMAASALVSIHDFVDGGGVVVEKAMAEIDGCYVVVGSENVDTQSDTVSQKDVGKSDIDDNSSSSYYALVDGNRVPKALPCDSESMVKGDSREYSIGAASILAKVTRDRLMREYHALYPDYELSKHKG